MIVEIDVRAFVLGCMSRDERGLLWGKRLSLAEVLCAFNHRYVSQLIIYFITISVFAF